MAENGGPNGSRLDARPGSEIFEGAKEWLFEHYIGLFFSFTLLSLIYQGVTAFSGTLFFRSDVAHGRLDGYCFAIRHPESIPLNLSGEPGRPLTVWMWRRSSHFPCYTAVENPVLVSPLDLSAAKPISPTDVLSSSQISVNFFPTVILTISEVNRPLGPQAQHTNDDEGAPSYRFLFVVEDEILFTDDEGGACQPQVEVQPGLTPSNAPRSSVFVQAESGKGLGSEVTFRIRALEKSRVLPIAGTSELQMRVESAFWSSVRDFFDPLLNTPALSVASFLAASIGYWQKRREEKQKRREAILERIERLPDLPKEQIWIEYWNLNRDVQAEDSPELTSRLGHAWRTIEFRSPNHLWAYEMRHWLARKLEGLRGHDVQEVRGFLNEFRDGLHPKGDDEESDVVSGREFGYLHDFAESSSFCEKPDAGGDDKKSDRECLKLALDTLSIIGLEATTLVLDWVKRTLTSSESTLSEGTLCAIEETWLSNGGAVGRFLMRQWSKENEKIDGKLREFVKYRRNLLNKVEGPCCLWRRPMPPLSESYTEAIKSLTMEDISKRKLHRRTPFGPVKAEMDPRLPFRSGKQDASTENRPEGLFWDGHKVWEEIQSERNGIFVCPPGSGRTTVIWMGRHRYRYGGVVQALSIYLPIRRPLDRDDLLVICLKGLAESLICALVRDPFWLLDADDRMKREIVGLLLYWTGNMDTLSRYLSDRGLLPEDPDGRLIRELLHQFSAYETLSWERLERVVGLTRDVLAEASIDNGFAVVFWVDVMKSDWKEEDLKNLVGMFLEEWGVRNLGRLKIFVPDGFDWDADEVPIIPLEWSGQDLKAMLEHRCEKVGFKDTYHWKKINEADNGGNPKQSLISDADGRPSALIRAGNRLLENWSTSDSME